MKTASCSLLFGVLAATACACAGETTTEVASTDSALSTWTKVTSCNDGAMVVDVAGYPMTPEPGHDPDYPVQAVIRDENVLRYLESRGAIARNAADRSEAIIPGHVWLSTFHTPRFDGGFISDPADGVTANVTRYGSGIKLAFVRVRLEHVCPSFCWSPSDPDYDPTSGVCEGCVAEPVRDEIANWWFGNCPVLADVHR